MVFFVEERFWVKVVFLEEKGISDEEKVDEGGFFDRGEFFDKTKFSYGGVLDKENF